jgi:hypothetical protein
MKAQPNPIRKHGDKTYDCPYLDDCRYYVALKNWQFWTCCQCPYKKQYVSPSAHFYPLTHRLHS